MLQEFYDCTKRSTCTFASDRIKPWLLWQLIGYRISCCSLYGMRGLIVLYACPCPVKTLRLHLVCMVTVKWSRVMAKLKVAKCFKVQANGKMWKYTLPVHVFSYIYTPKPFHALTFCYKHRLIIKHWSAKPSALSQSLSNYCIKSRSSLLPRPFLWVGG